MVEAVTVGEVVTVVEVAVGQAVLEIMVAPGGQKPPRDRWDVFEGVLWG